MSPERAMIVSILFSAVFYHLVQSLEGEMYLTSSCYGQLHRSPGSGLPRPQGRGGCAGQPDGLFPSTRLHPHRCEDLAPEPSSHLLSHQVIRMPQAGRRGSELLVCHCLAGLWRPGCPAPSPQAFPLPCLCLSVPLSVAPACPSPSPCAPLISPAPSVPCRGRRASSRMVELYAGGGA